jgi:TolA-binding protein
MEAGMRTFYVFLFYLAALVAGISAVAYAGRASEVMNREVSFSLVLLAIASGVSALILIGRGIEAQAVFDAEKMARSALAEQKLLTGKVDQLAEQLRQIAGVLAEGAIGEAKRQADMASCRLCGLQISRKVAKCPQCQTIQPTEA